MPLRIAVVGLGNIGCAAVSAIQSAPDMKLVGIVRRQSSTEKLWGEIPVVANVAELDHVDVALLCGPSRIIPEVAPEYLSQGISTVDSFDIHGKPLADLRTKLDPIAKANRCCAILSAGWDPGTDSIFRTLFLAMTPKGITHTNFGPGMSMGHSTVAKSKPGVKEALSMTIPTGSSVHRRLVYIELEEGADFELAKKAILEDPYFSHDDTRVSVVENVDELKDVGHGVHLERHGVSGNAHNQHLELRMRINNPSLTSQIMTSCARATKRIAPGAYTLPEIPPIDLLPGERSEWIEKIV